ncbi:translation initiation factor 2 [Pseudomonas sp. TE3610]
MRHSLLFSLFVLLLLGASDAQADDASMPLSLTAGSQITDLQQRLKDAERVHVELSQENQRLKLQLQEAQAKAAPGVRLLTEQQQWFVTGAGVALLAALCGIFISGGRRQRRQWLN